MAERRQFSREFKLEAIRLVTERGVTVAQAARDLDVHENVLREWVREYRQDAGNAFPGLGVMKPEQATVSVLLQELERFDGVCILASNRQASMDKALERRIGLRVEFPFPDRATRQRLWEVLIPSKMPLAADVRLDRLATHELSGGMVKNVVLNVARIACMRQGKRRATQADFERAIELEQGSRLSGGGGRRIGFAALHGK